MSSHRIRGTALVLGALAVMAALPIVISGMQNVRRGDSANAAGEEAEASRFYAAAARQLPWESGLWEKAGRAALTAGNYADAAALLVTARQRAVLSERGWEALGLAYWNQSRMKDAMEAWGAGLAGHPSSTILLDRLSQAFHQQQEFDAEEATLLRRLKIADDAGSRYRLGLLYMGSDDSEAEQQLRLAAEDSTYAPAAASLRAALTAAALEKDPSQARVVVGRGLGLVEEWPLAQRQFEQAVRADSRNGEARAWLGEARQHTGGGGEADLEAALRLAPESSSVRMLHALYLRRHGDANGALADYQAAAVFEPGNADIQLLLADAYNTVGDLAAAFQTYQHATNLAPSSAAAWSALALFCADNDIRLLDVAVPAAERANDLAPKDPQVLDALGWTYAHAGYYLKAEDALRRAIEAAPDRAITHLHLAETYMRTGEYASAAAELRVTANLDPEGASGTMAAQLLEQLVPGSSGSNATPSP